MGYRQAARKPGEVIRDAGRDLESTLAELRKVAKSALDGVRDKDLDPDEVEIEFGVKLSAEAGAIIAKSSVEGNFTIRLKWERDKGE